MTETQRSDSQVPNSQEQEALELYKAKRRGCIVKIIMGWLVLGGTIVILMIYTRSQVNRNPEEITAALSQLVSYQLPESFYPYSMNSFFGVELFVFWDKENVRDDERTKNIVAVYRDDRWKDLSVTEAATQFYADLDERLAKREFKKQGQEEIHLEGEKQVILVISGLQLLDDKYIEATTCYRFLAAPGGPLQVHSMGLNEGFPKEKQIEVLKSFSTVDRPLMSPEE